MAKDRKKELAELLGLDTPDDEENIQLDRADEGILAYLKHPELFKKVQCQNCSKEFAVSRRNVGYCGRSCRKEAISRLFGFEYNITPPKGDRDKKWVERVYNGEEPLIVSEALLDKADEILNQNSFKTSEELPNILNSIPNSINDKLSVDSDIESLLNFDISNL